MSSKTIVITLPQQGGKNKNQGKGNGNSYISQVARTTDADLNDPTSTKGHFLVNSDGTKSNIRVGGKTGADVARLDNSALRVAASAAASSSAEYKTAIKDHLDGLNVGCKALIDAGKSDTGYTLANRNKAFTLNPKALKGSGFC
jgi:hypothetical protein